MTPVIFLLRSTLCSGILLLYYVLVLKGRRLHSYNRFYLLAAAVLSLIVPVLHFEWQMTEQVAPRAAVHVLQAINGGDEQDAIATMSQTYMTMENAGYLCYAVVSLALLTTALMKIRWVYRMKRGAVQAKQDGYNIVYTDDDSAPFSFMDTLYWRKDIDIESEEGQMILRHELAHISGGHTVDKLITQCLVTLFWVNPFLWLMRKELSIVHEFIADEAAIQDRDTSSFAIMLLRAHYGNILPHIVNPFFSSSIKRRSTMLNNNRKTRHSTARRLMIIPMSAAMIFLFSFTVTTHGIPKRTHKILMVLDAAHGGDDMGATGAGNITEKDLTLAICKEMARVAGDYNIDVVQTRQGDKTVALDKRTENANAANATLLVSVHVNKDTADNPVTEGYEVIVSEKNREIEKSKVLASAVIASMQEDGLKPVLVNKGIHVLKVSNVPAIAIECGRIDNDAELAMLRDKAKLEAFCRNIMGGIARYATTEK